MNKTIREATQEWIGQFDNIPGSIFEKLIKYDEAVSYYDSDAFRMLASPKVECSGCSASYEGELSLKELEKRNDDSHGVACESCEHNKGDEWKTGYPEYAFPCGWGTLFAPSDSCDQDWFLENAEEVANLGIFVFESEDFGILLGIDGGGFDFYEAYWIPLYKVRGLQWHSLD